MIIDKRIKINDYNKKILDNEFPLDYICPKCKAKKNMTKHAYYYRNIVTVKENEFIYSKLKILRVKCNSCGSTHAILPIDIIPYKQFDYSCFLTIFENYFIDQESGFSLAETFNVSYQIYSTLRILEIIKGLFSSGSVSLIGFIITNFKKNCFQIEFNKINRHPFLMTKFQNLVTIPVFIGFK